jgi:hypothetical protein
VRSIGGVATVVVGLAAVLYFRILAPATATLDLEFEVKAPSGLSVQVDHAHSIAIGGKRRPNEWKIEIDAKVKNLTGKLLLVEAVRVEFRGEDGSRIPLRDPGIDTLVQEGKDVLFLPAGETRSYKTPAPLRIRASGGRNVVRGTIVFKGVKDFGAER